MRISLTRESPDADVLKAFKKAALKVHPDKGGKKEHAQTLQTANAKWDSLLVPQPPGTTYPKPLDVGEFLGVLLFWLVRQALRLNCVRRDHTDYLTKRLPAANDQCDHTGHLRKRLRRRSQNCTVQK